MNDMLVIVPTYNEMDNVRKLAESLFRAEPRTDLLFVDDNSPDGTGTELDVMSREEDRVHVLHRKGKEGLGRAYVAGFHWALQRHYDFVFEMDADFSHNPADVPRLRAAAEKADLVLGTRYAGGIRVINWPLHRLVLSRGAAVYVKLITGMPFSDPTGGFKCYRRAVLENLNLDRINSNGYSFQIETTHQAWRHGFRVAEVPITFEERQEGQSKMNGGIVTEALTMVWKLWCRNPGRRAGPRHARSVADA